MSDSATPFPPHVRDGDSVRSELLPDGRTRHWLADGRSCTVGTPGHKLDYHTYLPAQDSENDTYCTIIGIAGLSEQPGCFDAWNFDYNGLRTYSFRKTARVTDLKTGEVFSGQELREALEAGHTQT